VLDLHFAQIVQLRLPLPVLPEIVCHPLRKKDVPRIAAIHDSLRDVDSGPGNVGLLVQVSDFIDRATMNSHSDPKFGMTFQCFANFQSTQHWRFRTIMENQSAPVASR
jgi:hypothetical protein